MKNLFSKKLLGLASIILLSTNLFAAPKPGMQNMDTTPFQIILDKYYDVCERGAGSGEFTKEDIDALKPFTYSTDNEWIKEELDRCRGEISGVKQTASYNKKANLTKIKKVAYVSYNPNKKSYQVAYYYYQSQKDKKVPFTNSFRPFKDKDGKIVWKLL